MGGRRKTDNNRNKTKAVIHPSELHSYFYCPRVYFFETHIRKRKSIATRIRLFFGSIFHYAFRLRDIIKKYSYEIPIETDLGNLIIRGRPDAFKIDKSSAYVIERKSSKPPYKGAWISDIMQAAAYSIILIREKNLKEAKIEIRYPNKSKVFDLDTELVSMLMKALDEMLLVKYSNILPYAKRGNRCNSCPYKQECFSLDEGLEPDKQELFEPGSWIENLNLIY
ncbi:CRISPR-associated protein Cas4 [Caldisphaera sp.]|jgi:CRISPR-associated exonuclease Cas4|uniref:CRISPR-associated protein Cas4 n=1 Tax=Caldisphaera sp. TaxID=2060322 RepID=UPI000CBBED16|nr:MAG: CRISPR-associated protein Cas4 [Caldisphaera sp.]